MLKGGLKFCVCVCVCVFGGLCKIGGGKGESIQSGSIELRA